MCVVIALGRRLVTLFIIESTKTLLPQCQNCLSRTNPVKCWLFDRFIRLCCLVYSMLYNTIMIWIINNQILRKINMRSKVTKYTVKTEVWISYQIWYNSKTTLSIPKLCMRLIPFLTVWILSVFSMNFTLVFVTVWAKTHLVHLASILRNTI